VFFWTYTLTQFVVGVDHFNVNRILAAGFLLSWIKWMRATDIPIRAFVLRP
jgi:hypothetical protein